MDLSWVVSGLIVAVFVIAYLALAIWCLFDIWRTAGSTSQVRLLWTLLVVIAPLIGSILWLLVGRHPTSIGKGTVR